MNPIILGKKMKRNSSKKNFDSSPYHHHEEEEDNGVDLISNLPGCIIASIISLLPSIKEAARTSILSSRWRNLWITSPLHIDARSLRRESYNIFHCYRIECKWRVKVIDKILSRHRGPILSFHLSYSVSDHLRTSYRRWDLLRHHFFNWDRFERILNRWIEALARSGIQHLSLYYKIPSLTATCQSLRSLELVDIDFQESIRLPPNLALRELKLNECIVTHDILSCILTEYQVLATLEFERCSSFGFMRISSPYLKKLTLSNFIFVEYIVVEDVPNLEILVLGRWFTSHVPFTVVNAPKLRLLDFVNAGITSLQFGETCFQDLVPINWSTHLLSVKVVALVVNLRYARQAKALTGLLRCFPCLETLDILSVNQVDSSDLVDIKYWEREGSFDCLDRHLKYVKIKGFLGEHYDLGFTKFLVQNAQVLKVISIIYSYSGRKWKKPDLCKLVLKNKASLDAELILLGKGYKHKKLSTWDYLFD